MFFLGTFSLWCLTTAYLVKAQEVAIPAPNGTYAVGLVTLQLTNTDSVQPFAPIVEAPALELSVFYPTNSSETDSVPYMPAEVARALDIELTNSYLIDTPNGTLERLTMQLAPNGSTIASQTGQWPLLIFCSGLGDNRNIHNVLVAQVASTGYVVVTYDTPYTTDIVLYSNGSIIRANETYLGETNTTTLFAEVTLDNNVRAQDTSYLIDQFSNTSFVSSVIPGCDDCLNTSHVGVFGHSIGGSVAATVMLNDTRVAGALNYDGTLWGDVVEKGLDRPFFLMNEEGNYRAAFNESPANSWAQIWPRLTSSKFDLIVNGTAHNSFTDLPLILELLDLLPTNETTLSNDLLSSINGSRIQNIASTYAVSFFDWLLKNGTADLIAAPSPLFPEISLDTNTTSLEEASKGPPNSV